MDFELVCWGVSALTGVGSVGYGASSCEPAGTATLGATCILSGLVGTVFYLF